MLEKMSTEELKRLKRRVRYQWRTKNITSDLFDSLWDKVQAILRSREE